MLEKFLENREIFVTGGSGVVGKAVIEKLLRSCNVRKIYILLRPKTNQSVEERLEKIKSAMIFRQLRKEKPDELDEKLMAIPGDATLPFLGISCDLQKRLVNVSIIFHCAATVRFDESLRDAFKLNLCGTLETLKLAETLKHLEVFMHVSTFFSNPYLKRVEEKVYKSPIDWRICLKLLENKNISEEQLDAITKKLIVGFPNTYCFTKNLSESIVNDYRDKLPVAIFRPSIVMFALEEPEPGFSPTLMGSMGLYAVTGMGILKTLYIANDCRLDITPQDIGTKVLCFHTYKAAQFYKQKFKPNETPVYIASSCTHSDLTFPQYINIVQRYGFWFDAAFEKNFLIPGLYLTEKIYVYLFLVFFKQLLPSLMADLGILLSGRKPALMKANRKIFCAVKIFEPFTFNNYESSGVTHIDEMLTTLKGTAFNVDILKLVKNFYANVSICQPMPFSLREHLLKEDPKTLPRSKKILKTKIYIYNTIKLLFAFHLFNKLIDYIGY